MSDIDSAVERIMQAADEYARTRSNHDYARENLSADSLDKADYLRDASRRDLAAIVRAELEARVPHELAYTVAQGWNYSTRQPTDNVIAWRLGDACSKAAAEPKCGDFIDRGLILLRELEAKGYAVISVPQEPTR